MAGVLFGLAVPAGAASAPGEETQPETFDIWEFQVEGNTLMPATDIERAVYPHLGPAKSIVEVTLLHVPSRVCGGLGNVALQLLLVGELQLFRL